MDKVRGRVENMSGSWPAFCRMKDLGSRFNQSDQSLNPFNGPLIFMTPGTSEQFITLGYTSLRLLTF